jgi:hypothetical protein
LATYTNNFNLKKLDLKDSPPKITDINDNWDIIDEALANGSGSGDEVIKTYTITPEMWLGSAFPYICRVTHELGGEPTSMPLVDLDLSSCTDMDEVMDLESAYNNLYRVTFDTSVMTLYSKDIPEISFNITVKAVM